MNKRIKRLVDWLSKQGYSFRFSICDQVDWESTTVTLYPNPNQDYLLYTLLHECGHIVVGNYDSYKKEFKSITIADQKDNRHYRSNIYRYKKLKEEMDAWEEGKNLAKKLKIRINKDSYDKYAAKWFMTYVRDFKDPYSKDE
jgi:hypothetical protein